MKTTKRRILGGGEGGGGREAFYSSTEERPKCPGARKAALVFYHASEVELGLY